MKLNFVAAGLVLLALPAICTSPETPWEALRHLSKRHVYTALRRDGSCVTGSFVSLSENTLVLEQGGERPLLKPDIVRISSGETPDVHTAVYSGRSSWADLLALASPPYYSQLMLITADARQFSGPLLGVSNDQLTLMVDKKEMRFAKEFLARVFLTGKKPAFEQSGLHWSVLDVPKQPVPLYEVTAHEDDSKLDCAETYRRPQ